MSYDALVWCSLHGLVAGDRNLQRSGKVPGVGMVHASFALLPMSFPSSHWKQACEIAPFFIELVDRVSLDGKFLQDSLSRTKKVDAFTSRLLDIHSKMLEINKKEETRLGLHCSDYMLDEQTKLLLQIELNTVSSSFPGLSCLVTELHRGGEVVAVIYFRAGYTPTDYPSELEWRARLLLEQSSAIKCPSVSYHLAGTKKIQQELGKPGLLERFLDNKDDIAKVRRCFAGLWSLDDPQIIRDAIERPGLYVMKPQREGGGNNIYGDDVKEDLLRLQQAGNEEDAAYILMQRIFPAVSLAILMRDSVSYRDQTISELGVYGAYLRNKSKVIMNEHCSYLMRTKVSSSNEGGVQAGFAVWDSVYLV